MDKTNNISSWKVRTYLSEQNKSEEKNDISDKSSEKIKKSDKEKGISIISKKVKELKSKISTIKRDIEGKLKNNHDEMNKTNQSDNLNNSLNTYEKLLRLQEKKNNLKD